MGAAGTIVHSRDEVAHIVNAPSSSFVLDAPAEIARPECCGIQTFEDRVSR